MAGSVFDSLVSAFNSWVVSSTTSAGESRRKGGQRKKNSRLRLNSSTFIQRQRVERLGKPIRHVLIQIDARRGACAVVLALAAACVARRRNRVGRGSVGGDGAAHGGGGGHRGVEVFRRRDGVGAVAAGVVGWVGVAGLCGGDGQGA